MNGRVLLNSTKEQDDVHKGVEWTKDHEKI